MTNGQQRSVYMVGIVFLTFFVMSFVTNILGPMVPDIIESFHISLTAAATLPFAFFVAYGVLSIPAGFLVERWREKKVVLSCFSVAFAGSALLVADPVYPVVLASLFLIGGSMAALQVAMNPLLRTSGGEEHFAFYSAFAQLVFGIASFISPHVYSYMIRNLEHLPSSANAWLRGLHAVVPAALPWVSMYWIFAVVIGVITLLLFSSRFPQVSRDEGEASGTKEMYVFLLRKPVVWAFFLSVFLYVGSEQGTADWISEFLWKYHGYDPHTTGANAVAHFWGLLTIGCLLGMLLLKVVDSKIVLRWFSLGALLSLTVALFGPGWVSVIAFPCVGLFASIMWPVIISLGLNSVLEYPGPLTGILCSGIMGGAFVPLFIGRLADTFGLRVGMCLLYCTFGWVCSVAFWAMPLISNRTMRPEERAAC